VFNNTPLLLKPTLVGILPRRTLQAVVIVLGKALILHRYSNTSWCGLLTCFAKHSYVEWTEKDPEPSHPHV